MQFLDKHEGLKKTPLLRQLILFLVISLLLYLGLDILLHHEQIGLNLTQVTNTILGNEEEFLDPILFDSLLERSHFNILSSMITLMLLAVILIHLQPKQKSFILHFSFATAILSHVVLLLTLTSHLFIGLWIGLFILWHLLAFFMGFQILWSLKR